MTNLADITEVQRFRYEPGDRFIVDESLEVWIVEPPAFERLYLGQWMDANVLPLQGMRMD